MKKYGLNSCGYLSFTFRCMNIALKNIKAGVYSDFRRSVDASIYPLCRVNILIFSCHVLVIFLYI